MWLLNVTTRRLEAFYGNKRPSYAILSHRWEDEEVTFEQMLLKPRGKSRAYNKIDGCCREAAWRKLQYVWIDTCCIDKRSSAELSEAINSMYRWYAEADVCFAFLYDVETNADLAKSSWFTRAWTLQELLAPRELLFFNYKWGYIMHLATPEDRRLISDITGIPEDAFYNFSPTKHSVAERMSWASKREATRDEDQAYSLLGVFEVNMPMLYGEGKRAFRRLQEEIIRSSNDLSILAWSGGSGGFLAKSPADFENHKARIMSEGFSLNNAGLSLKLYAHPIAFGRYRAYLETHTTISEIQAMLAKSEEVHFPIHRTYETLTMVLHRTTDDGVFVRAAGHGLSTLYPRLYEDHRTAIETARLVHIQIARSSTIPILQSIFSEPPSLSLEANTSFRVWRATRDTLLVNLKVIEQHTRFSLSYPDGTAAGFPVYVDLVTPGGQKFFLRLGHDFLFRPCCFVSPQSSVLNDAVSLNYNHMLYYPMLYYRKATTEMLSILQDLADATATDSGRVEMLGGGDAVSAYCGRRESRSCYTIPGLTIDFQPRPYGHFISMWV